MHARVSTYDLALDKLEEGIRGFRQAVERIRELDGLHEVIFLVDRENGRAVTITLWDSSETMNSSRVAASRARSEAARTADGEVQSTCEYEVVLRERGGA
ncbi:MAG: hypothetical protein M3321_09970 [Actinomycetota bacterium]|nr:hypothetical protein [Actinomycetota bacterium]